MAVPAWSKALECSTGHDRSCGMHDVEAMHAEACLSVCGNRGNAQSCVATCCCEILEKIWGNMLVSK